MRLISLVLFLSILFISAAPSTRNTRTIFQYTVMESCGNMYAVVELYFPTNNTITIDYRTEDGTAFAGEDYVPAEGTLVFYPGETNKWIPIYCCPGKFRNLLYSPLFSSKRLFKPPPLKYKCTLQGGLRRKLNYISSF